MDCVQFCTRLTLNEMRCIYIFCEQNSDWKATIILKVGLVFFSNQIGTEPNNIGHIGSPIQLLYMYIPTVNKQERQVKPFTFVSYEQTA